MFKRKRRKPKNSSDRRKYMRLFSLTEKQMITLYKQIDKNLNNNIKA